MALQLQSIREQRRDQMYPAFDPTEIERVRKFGKVRSFAGGERFWTAGQVAPGLMVVIAGIIAVTQHDQFDNEEPIGILRPGNFLSQTESSIKVIVANPTMMAAYRDGLPADGKLFPDGSKVAKIEWTFKRNTVSPYFVNVPDTLKSVSFIEKAVRRFPNSHGWAYAQFDYDTASDTFKPSVTGGECGYACHMTVAAQDYIFTAYPKR
jgi:hypothetical protein